jgi:uncharacterized protein (DUF1810 family)
MKDPYSLQRFIDAQAEVWPQVVQELQAGRKRSHWMWFIFPQLPDLGRSDTARHFAIRSLEEARAYLRQPVLGPRLVECAQLVIGIRKLRPECSAFDIFGTPDDLKFHSSMTLFAEADPKQPEFAAALALYFDAQADPATLARLSADAADPAP